MQYKIPSLEHVNKIKTNPTSIFNLSLLPHIYVICVFSFWHTCHLGMADHRVTVAGGLIVIFMHQIFLIRLFPNHLLSTNVICTCVSILGNVPHLYYI